MSDDENDEAIFRVDTVPPPAGEDDAYNAPTRVGAMAAAVVEEMMVASSRKASELTAAVDAKVAAHGKQAAAAAKAKEDSAEALSDIDLVPDTVPGVTRGGVSGKPPPVPQKPAGSPPRIHEDADFENAATALSVSSQPPAVQPLASSAPHASAITSGLPAPAPAPGAVDGRLPWTVFLPLAVGFAIFTIGCVLYLWAR